MPRKTGAFRSIRGMTGLLTGGTSTVQNAREKVSREDLGDLLDTGAELRIDDMEEDEE